MGDSTCLMQVQQPFSYASGVANEANDGNPIYALGQSVSFGRFMSESLSWEKWSTFSHNKYVEEAERHSRPGSVAQKKAFFEAHYRKIAERKKAAALLEQAQDASNIVAESDAEDEVNDDVTAKDSEMTAANSPVTVDERQVVKANDHGANVFMDKCESNRVEDLDLVNENNFLAERSGDVKSPKQLANDNSNGDVKEMELSGTAQMDKYVKVESTNQFGVIDSQNEVTDLQLSGTTQMEKPQLKTSNSNQDDRALTSKKKSALSSSKSLTFGRASKVPSTPAKAAALSHPEKENIVTPINKKSTIDTAVKKRSTPKSIHKSIYSTPAKEINRFTSRIIRKIDGSKAIGSNSKASKDCSAPLRTPTKMSINAAPKHLLATPWSENGRAETPHESTSGSRTVRAKWNFLPRENKLQSPKSFTPFRFRTEERAARRKERLEEKFNADQALKMHEQATLKEKAETEIRKLHQTLCFKARPLPDFYKERAISKNQMKKDPPTRPQSPKLTSSTVQSKPSTPRLRAPTKTIGSNHVLEKKSHPSTRSLASRPTKITHENTSPNIQCK